MLCFRQKSDEKEEATEDGSSIVDKADTQTDASKPVPSEDKTTKDTKTESDSSNSKDPERPSVLIAVGKPKTSDEDKTEVSEKKQNSPLVNGDAKSDEKSDSDKENGPIDLSNKSASSPDVIMLSDDEEELMRGIRNRVLKAELTPAQLREHNQLVRAFQEELRNEEAKLVLLKKVRQSQLLAQVQENQAPAHPQQPKASNIINHQPKTAPPPLVRGGQLQVPTKQSSLGGPPQLVRGLPSSHHRSSQGQGQGGPPPLVMAPNQHRSSGSSSGHHNLHNIHHSTSAPNLQNYRQGHQQLHQQSQPQQPEQTPAQRQAAAKLALRKQLEKTLLQIPPPKPPPPEMNFIPSLVGNEFMMLVGLEEVVTYLQDAEAKSKGEKTSEKVKYVFNPFTCVQCGTDFTPVWKREKPGSKNVICEHCVTTNQKKALKQEHTNRLKSAFVKALQQEQEIEQRMQQNSSSSERGASSNSSGGSGSHSRSNEGRSDTSSSQHHSVTTTTVPGIPSIYTSHAHASPMNLATGFKPTTEQLRQHQTLLQAHQAQLRTPLGLQHFAPRLPFPFQAPPLTQKDLQRQYLLDMIPRSMPGGTVLWQT